MAQITNKERFLRKELLAQGLKKCSRCDKTKEVSAFNKSSTNADGLSCRCVSCKKEYNKSTAEMNAATKKVWYLKNKEENLKKYKEYHQRNKEAVHLRKKEHNKTHKAAYKERSKAFHCAKCTSTYLMGRVNGFDISYCAVKKRDQVEVKCHKCKKYFSPTNLEVRNFLRSGTGYRNMYCSELCKSTCVDYNFNIRSVDPRVRGRDLKYETQKVRRCQTDHLKQLQIDEIGYNYCEKCGGRDEVIELHHTLEIAKFGLEAINSAGHILLCESCHKEVTRACI